MVDNATAVAYWNMMHQNNDATLQGLIFLMGMVLGALVVWLVVYYEVRKLRIDGRQVSRMGVYTFTQHTPDTMKEYLEKRKKEKELS